MQTQIQSIRAGVRAPSSNKDAGRCRCCWSMEHPLRSKELGLLRKYPAAFLVFLPMSLDLREVELNIDPFFRVAF